MAISATTSTNATNTAAAGYDPTQTPQPQLPQQTLNQADFLKLLVAQLSAQDPLNPVSNTDFAAQMAQFSTLQATQTMQTDLAAVQAGLSLLEAGSFLGKTVNVQDSSGQAVTGTVTAVQYQGGSPSVIVNGQSYDVSQVTSVSQPPAPAQSN
jgi:flagellar basal-body rod modification protein FlgD